ncbi:efflux RND transporter periplasmic adaptor subunit [Litoreibacter roseus]|nr:efflux RND transporter periplasmic adaptor subunit [Litoreibacter roseus]
MIATIGAFVSLALLVSASLVSAQGFGNGDQPPPAVLVTEVRPEARADENVYPGRVRSTDRLEIVPRVTGFLEKPLFEIGDYVEAGTLLFQIEPSRFAAQLRAVEAQLASAEAQRTLARATLERTRELATRSATPQARLDEAQAAFESAVAEIAQLTASRDLAQIDLQNTEIRAPFSGRMSRSVVAQGALVGPTSGPLAMLVAEDPTEVVFAASQQVFLDVRRDGLEPGDVDVLLRLMDGSVYSEIGQIVANEVTASGRTDAIEVTARIANPEGSLIDGQLVDVVIRNKQPTERLVLPQAALLLDQQGTYVLGVDETDTVIRYDIKTGVQIGTEIEVTSGIETGAVVIVSGLTRARPGLVVAPQFARAQD